MSAPLLLASTFANAYNARSDRKAAERAGQFATEQLRRSLAQADQSRAERIEWDGASLAEQIARERKNLEMAKADQDANLARIMESMQANIAAQQAASDRAYSASGREVGRQQEYGRAQGDAFASSLGEFGNFNQDMAAKSDSLAAIFSDMLGRDGPAAVAPEASGRTADFEAAMRAQASGEVGSQAQKLAALQAFGGTMADKNLAMGRNQQLDAIIQNFARGSQSALGPEVDAASMYFQSNPILTKTPTASLPSRGQYIGERFIEQQYVKPAPSMMGDLIVGLAGAYASNQQKPAAAPNPYALTPPTTSGLGFKAEGGLGINTTRPAGLGIR
jgi:hypothetical protein